MRNQTEPHAPFTTDILYADNMHEPLTHDDIMALKALHVSLKEMGERAAKHKVRIAVDAEHTYVFHLHVVPLSPHSHAAGISLRLMLSLPI